MFRDSDEARESVAVVGEYCGYRGANKDQSMTEISSKLQKSRNQLHCNANGAMEQESMRNKRRRK
jgi:hypothetical protein